MRNPILRLPDQNLQGFGATEGKLSLSQVLTNPTDVIETYKGEAIKYGIYGIVGLVVLNHLQLHIALNQKLKKFRR